MQHLGDCAKIQDDTSISCACKSKKNDFLESSFKNYSGAAKQRQITHSKNVVANSYNLYKPYRPCRRTCCGNHNPMHIEMRI